MKLPKLPDDSSVSSCPHTFDQAGTVQDNDQDLDLLKYIPTC